MDTGQMVLYIIGFVFAALYLRTNKDTSLSLAYVGVTKNDRDELVALRKQFAEEQLKSQQLRTDLAVAQSAIQDMPALREALKTLQSKVDQLTLRVSTLESEKTSLIQERDAAIKRADEAELKALTFQAKYEALVAIGIGKPEVKP